MAKRSLTASPRRGITAPQGFRAAGIHCGIKKPGLLDLALVVSEQSGPIAGVFTRNQVVAAPVTVDRLHLRQGIGRAILVNSGNANGPDRKSTRLNSSHTVISYAVFCL